MKLRTLKNNNDGLALIEFTMLLPVLIVILLGGVEFTRYVILTQKTEKSAYTLASIVSQYQPITYEQNPSEVSVDSLDNQAFPAFVKAMDAYSSPAERVAIVTSLSRTGKKDENNSLTINWQRTGGGTLSTDAAASEFNGTGARYINSESPNGSTSGNPPDFPASKSDMLDGRLDDMSVGENMIVVETFYSYKPIFNNILGMVGLKGLGDATFKSVVYSRPRKGDLLTLVRPDHPEEVPEIPPPVITQDCWSVDNNPPRQFCNAYPDKDTCTTRTECFSCIQDQICRKCTTPYGEKTTCRVFVNASVCPMTPSVSPTPDCTAPNPKSSPPEKPPS